MCWQKELENKTAVHRYDAQFMEQHDPHCRVDHAIEWLQKRTKAAAQETLDLNSTRTGACFDDWKNKAQDYFSTNPPGEKISKSILSMAYGSAVEERVNRDLPNYPHRYTYPISKQQTSGQTRPDIVIKDRQGNIMSWVDITSENSLGHIYKKKGAGWRNKPVVAEVLYDPLDPDKIIHKRKEPR